MNYLNYANEIWTDLQGIQYPEGLPVLRAIIDFEWQCTAEEEGSIAPLIGTAKDLDSDSTYFWLSQRLANENHKPRLCRVGGMIQLLVAHNTPADRTKVYESSLIEDTILWHDTMARHTLLAGATSGQQFLMRMHKDKQFRPYFMGYTAMKNLLDVYNFWVNPEVPLVPEDKALRRIFFKGSMDDIRKNFIPLMTYALRDVELTKEVYQAQDVLWQKSIPSNIRSIAAGIRANVSMAVSDSFEGWLTHCEGKYMATLNYLNGLAQELVISRCLEYQAELSATIRSYSKAELPPEYFTKSGAILKRLSHTNTQNINLNPETREIVDKWDTKYGTRSWEPGRDLLPKWFKEASDLSFQCSVIQDLCDLKYFDQAVCYRKDTKFNYIDKAGIIAKIFSPKKGSNTLDNCGSLFGQDFIGMLEDGSIKSDNPLAKIITVEAAKVSYWTGVRSRLYGIVLLRRLIRNTELS